MAIDVCVLLTVREAADVERVLGLLGEHARASRAEPGCERFEVLRSTADGRTLVLLERYASPEALAAHREGRTFREVYLPGVLPRVDRVAHECQRLDP